MAELDEKRVREIVKDEITDSIINERLAVIETKLDQKADKSDITILNYMIASIKVELNNKIDTSMKTIIALLIAILASVIIFGLTK